MLTLSPASPLRAALLALPLALAACDEAKSPTARADAGADAAANQPVLDGKLGEAVAAATASASANPAGKPSPSAPGGPPESGVFAPGEADVAHAKGAAVKIEVLGEGSEPRVTLASPAAKEQKTKVTVAVRLGPQQAMPTIDFDLALKIDKPKDKEKPEGAAPAPVSGGPVRVIAKVVGASLSAEQPGSLPKELGDQIKKLKGSVVKFSVGPNGAGSDYVVDRAKEADASLEAPLHAMVETVSILTPALPPKPVGVGGFWMATDRAGSFGVDVIRYRVFKVEKIDGTDVTLSVECRQFASEAKMSISLGPEKLDLAVDRFDSQGKGQLGLGAFLPSRGELTQKTQAVVLRTQGAQPGQAGQRMAIQTDVTTKVR